MSKRSLKYMGAKRKTSPMTVFITAKESLETKFSFKKKTLNQR